MQIKLKLLIIIGVIGVVILELLEEYLVIGINDFHQIMSEFPFMY